VFEQAVKRVNNILEESLLFICWKRNWWPLRRIGYGNPVNIPVLCIYNLYMNVIHWWNYLFGSAGSVRDWIL